MCFRSKNSEVIPGSGKIPIHPATRTSYAYIDKKDMERLKKENPRRVSITERVFGPFVPRTITIPRRNTTLPSTD